MKKLNLILMIAVSFFSIAVLTTYVAKAASTWQGPPSNCTSPSTPGCNVDGVIWNTDTPQDARFNITGKGTIGGGLEVTNSLDITDGITPNFSIDATGGARNNFTELMPDGDVKLTTGKALRADVPGDSSILNIGNFSQTGKYVDVDIYGNLLLRKTPDNQFPKICFDDSDPASCRTSWPAGGGGFTQAEADLLYVKKGGDVMTGVLSNNVGFQATNYVSSPNIYLGTLGVNPYSELHNSWWRISGDSGKVDLQPNVFGMIGKTWAGNRPFTLSMRSVGDYNKQTGWIGMGDPDNVGDFIRYGTGKTSEVVLLSSVSAGDDYGSMVGVVSNLTNAAGHTAGMFKYSDDSKRVELVNQTYAMNVKGDANFQNQICLGGVCKNAWPAGIVTGQTVGGGLQLNAGNTLGIQNCPAGNIMKSTGISTWGCSADQNSGGTITGVTAGSGLTGGGAAGAVTVNLDTAFTDGRYIKKTGDTMNGGLTISGGNLAMTGVPTANANILIPATSGIGFDGNRDNTGFLQLWNDGIFYWDLGTGSKLYLRPSGGASAPIYFDAAIGKGYQTGGGSWSASSDIRLKKNLTPIIDALGKLTKLQGYYFDWRNPAEHGTKSEGGFIAQEVERIFPSWVHQEKTMGADKNIIKTAKTLQLPFEFDALVVESIKELKAENDALQAKNAELERRLEALENKLK